MSKPRFAIMVVLTTLMMGVAFPIGKIGLAYTTPFLLMGLRFLIAGVLMGTAVWKRPLPRRQADWGRLALLGTFQSAGVMGCAYYSMRWITSGESAILTFMNPLLVILLGTIVNGMKYRLLQWFGVIVGFLGLMLTFGYHVALQPGTVIGFMGAVSFAIATLLAKRWGTRFDVWVMTAAQMLFGGIVLLLIGALIERPHIEWNSTLVFVLLWLAIMSSIVQFSGWYYLLQHGDPGRTSAFLFLAPFFGVLSGWLMLGELVHWYVWAGGGLICVGIFLVNGTTASSGTFRIREMDERGTS